MHGIHAVVGTTGLTDDDLAAFREEFGDGGPNCVVAANFSISAVLMMRFAEIAAPFFDTAEIIELHHDAKADAPSGTALATAERMAAASDRVGPRPDAARGARPAPAAAPARPASASTRCGCAAWSPTRRSSSAPLGQTLTIRQDSYDRESFMPGVLLACKHIAEHPGLTVGLDAFLGPLTRRPSFDDRPDRADRRTDRTGRQLEGGEGGVVVGSWPISGTCSV